MAQACSASFEDLIDYRFGALDDAAATQLEAHLFECARCGARAALLDQLGRGVALGFRQGGFSSGASAELAEHAAELGLRLRTYAIAPGRSVACTAAPDDDLVVVRLRLNAPDAERIDVETDIHFAASGKCQSKVLQDVGFDRAQGEVIYFFAGDFVRSLPRSTWRMQATVHSGSSQRRVGPYTMNHTPWAELAQP